MQITVFADKEFLNDWHVEVIDNGSGDVYQSVFSGPDAEQRAREYAIRRVAVSDMLKTMRDALATPFAAHLCETLALQKEYKHRIEDAQRMAQALADLDPFGEKQEAFSPYWRLYNQVRRKGVKK